MFTILPYNAKTYGHYYNDEFLSSFTHGNLASGDCDINQARSIVKSLRERPNDISPLISFNQKNVKGKLTDGACSAIVFRLAKEVLPILKSYEENQHLSLSNREKIFLKDLTNLVIHLEEVATGEKASDKAARLAIRTEQMALNTITVDQSQSHTNHAVAEKIGAMAYYFGLKTVDSSDEIQVNGNENFKEDLSHLLNSLKNGAYLMRIIKAENNEKLEKEGHSLLYIKTMESEYYFDPALGCFALFQEALKTNLVYNATLSANQRFGVDVLSVHRLEEKIPVKKEKFALFEPELSGVIYSPCQAGKDLPVIIFSPALGNSIESYQAFAKELSKRGFIVMCVDHPKTGTGVAKLKESEIMNFGIENGVNIEKLAALIGEGYFKQIPPNAKIAVMGHSLGGSSSLEACRNQPQIKAAINLDGRIIKPEGIHQPILQIVANQTKEDRTKYNLVLDELSKTNTSLIKKDFEVKHGDFSNPSLELLDRLLEESTAFFRQHLIGEEQK